MTSPKAVNSGQTQREAFEPVGRCTCAFSQDECEVCQENRESYQERQMENETIDDKFAPHRLKVAEECCERLMSACTDAGCPDGVPMDDWIRDVVARAASTQASAAAPQGLSDEQRDALNEAIAWANDDGLPGTADMLRSILAEQSAAPMVSEQADEAVKRDAQRWNRIECVLEEAQRNGDLSMGVEMEFDAVRAKDSK